jgi:phage-related protein
VALPKYGIQATVEGLPAFKSAMDTIDTKIKNVTKSGSEAGKNLDPFSKGLDKVGVSVDSVRDKLKGFIQDNVPFGNQLSGIVDKLVAIPLPALAAATAVVALGAAFIELGNRGAPLQELGIAFDKLTASIGLTSTALLKDLRAASEGTIADFDLIKTASTALLGVSGEFGKSFGKALPEFLKIAKVEADATGRSVNELFNNLVEGVKKGTPKLIENTGLVIDQKAAYQDYAKTLGITVAQLSDADRSQALLNATLAAGQVAIDSLSGSLESNADKLDRQQATLTNIADTFAIAVQPAFGTVLDGVQSILNIFQQLATALAPIFGGIVSAVANVFSTVINIVTSIAQPFVDAFSSIAPYIALVFQTVANIIGGVGKIIGDIVGGIVKFLSDVGKNLFGIDLKTLGPQLFNGAAAAFGSFANGIIAVANKLIFPAVIGIAKFIADFLIGFSPPKEGPLSMIDKGGENLMKSWLEGISGVSLDPVKQVAQEVSDALGVIGRESLKRVNVRLAQLDKALLPFQNRLDIIKAQFDALNEPAQQALDAIDRQTAALQDAIAQGDPQAAERLKLLDQQRDAIQGQVDAQQALVDRAQIQLALAKAQQAPERALLTIRQAYLNALAKAQPKPAITSIGTGAGVTPPKAGGAGAGAITPPGAGGAVPTAPGGALPSVLDLIGGQDKVDAAAQGLSDAFMGAIDQTGLQDFAQNQLDLGTQIGRIKSVDLGAKLKDKFKSLTDAFDPANPDSIPAKVTSFVQTLTGSAETPGSIASFFAGMGDSISNTKDSIVASVQGTLNNIFDPNIEGSPANIARNAVQTLTADANTEGSLASAFSTLGANLAATKDIVGQGVSDFLNSIFDPQTEGTPMNVVLTAVGNLTGDPSIPDSVAYLFSQLPTNISNAIPDLLGTLQKNIFDPVTNFLSGTGEGTISGILDQTVAFFTQLPALIVNALRNLGGMIYGALAVPVISAINSLIGAVEGGVKDFMNGIAGFLEPIAGALGTFAPQFLLDAINTLHGAAAGVKFGRISTELPAFLQPLGGAKGGIFSPGLMKVGERGPELMFNATKMGVLPNQLVSVLGDLSRVLAQPMPMPIAGGNSYNSSNSSFTFNGVQSDNDARRRYNYLRAGMR